MSQRSFPLAVLAALALAIAGCGGSSSAPGSDTAAAGGTSTATATATAPAQTGDLPPKVELTDGVYTAPGGVFTFRPDPSWDSADAGSEIYFATNPARTDTITIVGEPLDGAPSNLDDYVTISLESAPDEIDGFKMLSRRTITLPSGDEAQRLDYIGSIDGSPPMRFLSIVTVSDANSVTATFAAPRKRFPAAVGTVEPVLRTVDVS